jgi:hypothetical protein
MLEKLHLEQRVLNPGILKVTSTDAELQWLRDTNMQCR